MHQLLMAFMIDFTFAVSTLSAVQKQNLHIDASVMILMVTAIVLMIAAMMCCPWMHTSIDFHRNDSTNYSKKDVPYYRPC